jgi:uncharacterized membrane protein YbhN (UPF0104 family)
VSGVLGMLGERLTAVAVLPLLAAVCLLLLRLMVKARAWQLVLRASCPAERPGLRDALGPYLVSVGVNTIVPAKAGVVPRIALAKARLPSAGYATLAGTLAVEGVLNLIPMMVVLATAYLVLRDDLPSDLIALDWATIGLLAPVAVILILATGALTWLARRHRSRADAVVATLRQGFALFAGGRSRIAAVVGWESAAWGLRLASIVAFLHAFHIAPTLQLVMLVVLAQLLASLVPFAALGVGVQQVALMGALAGAASPAAIAQFGLGMQAVVAATDLGAGLVGLALVGSGAHLGDLSRAVRRALTGGMTRPRTDP